MPELKQIWDLSQDDFQRYGVWVGVHNVDIHEPWYKSSDEATYRPWDGELPARSAIGSILVRAELELQNGAPHPGFFTAVRDAWDLPPHPGFKSISSRYGGAEIGLVAVQQPRIFLNGQEFTFWGGRSGVGIEKKKSFYDELGMAAEDIFPIRYRAEKALAIGILSGEVNGFYKVVSKQGVQIEW